MGLLSWFAWGTIGFLGAKDAYDNYKYTNKSKEKMVATNQLFYSDSKGRMYYGATGEQIMLSFRDNRRVYINVKTGRVVCDLTSIHHQRFLEDMSKLHRQLRIKVDKGTEWCNFDFKEWRYYGLKDVPVLKEDGRQDIGNYNYFRTYYKEDANHNLIMDGDWFPISKEEYKELGGNGACGPRTWR